MKLSDTQKKRRKSILEAAIAEFSGRRFDEVRLDDIAARAGVGKGTLYLYFKNKEDLFLQMAVEGVDEMARRINAIAAAEGPFRERFSRFGSELSDFVNTRSPMFRLMHQIVSETIRTEFLRHHRQLVQATRGLLQRGIDEGALRSDFTAADLHCMLIGPLLFRARLNENNHDSIEAESLLKLFWAAAACREGSDSE